MFIKTDINHHGLLMLSLTIEMLVNRTCLLRSEAKTMIC